jgi:tight adherence protein C
MQTALLTFVSAFLLISAGGSLIFCRRATLRRLARIVEAPSTVSLLLRKPSPRPAARVAHIIEPFHRFMPKTEKEASLIQKRLARAGLREKTWLNIFYGAKLLAPITLCLLLIVFGVYKHAGFFPFILAAGLGFLVPDFWLDKKIKGRQRNLRLGLPDALDLIIICVEAGLGMDKAVMRATEELWLSQPEMADELALVTLEQRAGRPRVDAWKSLGERTQVEPICALASILVQADKFGTSIGKALRAHAEALRTRRRQDAEELAAKTTIKLMFPLVLFIFPSLFVVTLGPSLIVILEQMKNFLN